MCGGKVAQVVRERIEREGLPNIGRRSFLKGIGLFGLGAVSAGHGARVAASPRQQDMMGEVVDLSHLLSVDFPVFPAFQPAQRESLVTVEENGFYAQQWTFGEHTSTHLDAPGHFIGGGALVPELSADRLVGPAVVINIAERAADNPDAMVTVDDVMAWEEANGPMPEGAFVLMHSGWEEKLAEDGAYSGTDAEGVLHFPGFSPEVAEFLVNERNIKGVGTDTLSIDNGPSSTFDVHYQILGAGLLGIENLQNLASIEDSVATLILGIPNYEEGSGGPMRVLAMR